MLVNVLNDTDIPSSVTLLETGNHQKGRDSPFMHQDYLRFTRDLRMDTHGEYKAFVIFTVSIVELLDPQPLDLVGTDVSVLLIVNMKLFGIVCDHCD